MIKKLSIFLIILFIFSFINVNKIYGEEEKSFEISFNNPYFVDYSDFSLPEFENFDNFILIPGSPIIPYKIYNYEFSLNTEIISISIEKKVDYKNYYKLNKPLLKCPEPKLVSDFPINETFNTYDNFENYIIERTRDSLIVHLRLSPLEYSKDDLKEVNFYSKLLVRIKYKILSSFPENTLKSNYDLLIITPQEFQDTLTTFINHKNQKGILTTTLTLEYINSTFSGRDLQEKIKYAIKYALDNWSIKYVLLIGDSEKIPPRYVAVNDGEESTLPSDLYYADIYNSLGQFDTWDKNNNNIFGEYNSSNGNIDKPDLYPDVSIGRIPVSNLNELNNYIQKVIYYETNNIESWFKKTLLVGVATFSYPNFAEGEYCKETIATNYLSSFQNNKLYQTDLYQNTSDPTPTNINNVLNSGVGFLNFAGHGGPTVWGNNNPSITCYNVSSNMSGLNNENKLPVIFSNACSTARYDDTEAMPEYWLTYYMKGAVGFIGATRLGWAYTGQWFNNGLIGKMDNLFFKGYSLNNKDILGETWRYMISNYITENGYSSVHDFKTITELGLFGDPSLKIGGYSQEPPPPKVTLIQPNGGESLTAGSSYKI
ncbi:MAG: C25 family cysteine peptidase, partial [Caldisericia bacterium]